MFISNQEECPFKCMLLQFRFTCKEKKMKSASEGFATQVNFECYEKKNQVQN